MRSEAFANPSNNNIMPRRKTQRIWSIKKFLGRKKNSDVDRCSLQQNEFVCAKTKEELSESFSTDAEPNTYYLVLQEDTCKLSR